MSIPRHPRLRRLLLITLFTIVGFGLVFGAALYFLQERMIYFPRHYEPVLLKSLAGQVRSIQYQTACGRQTAFYLPPKKTGSQPPARLWVFFSGNASLALDWLDLLDRFPDPQAGILLFDYPGYGECQGRPSPRAIDESAEAALVELARDLQVSPEALCRHLNLLGYSLGCSPALTLATRHATQRIILIAPFTRAIEIARGMFGWPLCQLLRHRFDNRASLAALARSPHRPEIVIFHGDRDRVVPIAMGRELAQTIPDWIEFHPIGGADHVSILDVAEARIQAAMAPMVPGARSEKTRQAKQ